MDNQIGIVITGTNNSIAAFERLKGDLDAVAVSAKAVTESQKAMAMQGREATTTQRELATTVKSGNTAFRRNAVAVRQSRTAIARWRVEADRAGRAGERYRESAELASVALGLAARNTTALARAQIQGAANLERLLIGLDAITGSLDAANAQYHDLIQVSRLPGINIENSLRATLQLQALGKTGEESTRIIREFGNSLALAGTPPRELRQVINAIRQLSGEGKILQEDLSIITSRIAPIIPLMQQAFGGTRAEDVRRFYDALGTPPSQQAERFLETILEGLERLPRAGSTAANSLENLSDTVGRVQARIGSNFLPLVKEATAAIEGALMSIERSPTAARNIASLEAFAGGLLGITAAAAALQASIKFLGPSLLAFATGPVGIAAAAAGAAAGAYLAWEVNLTSATEAQLKSLETEKTRLQLFREVQGLIAADDTAGLATREDALSKSVAAANTAYERQVSVVEEARQALEAYNRQTEQLEESPGARSARSAERGALALRDPSQLEEGLREAEARLNALNRARTAANRIAADAAALVATAQTAVVTPSDTLDTQIDALAQSATEGSTAIARALQQIQDIDANTGETGLERQQDIALAIGDQLVSIAEATTVKQLDAAKRRVAGLARDNSLIIENETGLQNLLLAAESQFRERKIALITAAGKETASERIRQEVEAEREASAQGLLERQRAAQRAREQARRATTQLLTQSNEQIGDVLSQLRDADISDDQFASLNVQFEMLVANLDNLGVAVPNIGRLREELAGIADLRIDDQLSGLAEVTQRNQEAAFAGAREAGQQLTRRLLEGGEAVQREFARKRIQATRQVVRQIESIESRLAQTQSVNSLERLQNDTRQLRSELQERGQAWQAHTDRVTALSRDISDSLDEALRTERLEKFQDAVANVVSDLANVGFDFIFDSLTDSTDRAAEAIEEYTYEVDGAQRAVDLLVSDITRLNRLQEDTALGGERLREDRARAVRNLQRRLRETAASQPVGDQRGIQRNIERQQDIRARLRERREDFDVRIGRFDQDAALRQSRLIEDAVSNRDRAEAGPGQEGFLEQLLAGLANTISSSLSDLIGNAVAGALAGALTNPFNSLIDSIKGLFGGDGQAAAQPPGTQQPPQIEPGTPPDLRGKIAVATEDITVPAFVDLKGKLVLADADINKPATPIALTGEIVASLVKNFVEPIPLTGVINATINPLSPDSIDLSGIPVTLPVAAIKVDAPDSVDLSKVPVINIPTQSVQVETPDSVDLSNVPVTNIAAQSVDVTTPDTVDLSNVPVLLPNATIRPSFDTSELLPISLDGLVPGEQRIKVSFDTSALANFNPNLFVDSLDDLKPKFDTSGLANFNPNYHVEPFIGVKPFFNLTDPPVNFNPNDFVTPLDPITPTINVPNVEMPAGTPDTPASTQDDTPPPTLPTPPPSGTTIRDNERLQQIIDRAPGQGRGAVSGGGEGSGGGFLNALSGLKDSIESGLESGLSALPDSVEGVVRSILGAGVSVGGDGVGLGAGGGTAFTDEQVEALAASLAEGLGESFRSDFIPTLMGNQPGQVQPGSADPDEDIAQAPAAPRFGQAAAAGVSNVAQESTLAQTNFELLALRTFTENGLPNSIATALAQGLASEGTALLTRDEEAIKGLQTLNELMASALERPQGTAEDKLYVTLAGETLKVEVINPVRDVNANIINDSIRVETGVVTVLIAGTPVSVRIEDLGALLLQLSHQNTASDSFGGQTI